MKFIINFLFFVCSVISKNASYGTLVTFYDNSLVTTNYKSKYTIGDLTVYHFEMDYSPLEWDGNVMDMDINHSVELFEESTKSIWNLDRISHRRSSRNKEYTYDPSYSGKGQTVYVIDTGIDIDHTEFEGRAFRGFDSTNDPSCINLHGTHVAGTVGSKTYGVAKDSTIVDVRVLNCKGSGSYSGIIAAIEWVSKQKKGVSNMSLGGPKSNVVNKALGELSKLGHYVVVAAGNENADACNVSPASENSAITVGATKEGDAFSSFSNWGKCVDIVAPGENILSTVPGGKIKSLAGTSMASPHVAGVIAVHLESYGFLPLDIMRKLLYSHSTKNQVRGLRYNTVNSLLYSMY